MTQPHDFLHSEHSFLVDPSAGKLRMRWLGNAGYELTVGSHTVLIDPYLTRVGLWRVLTSRIQPDPAAIDAAIRGPVDAILVSHSHFDHVMDAPYIAKKTGAVVYGSQSTANLMRASGLPESQVVRLEPKRATFEVGPFEITAVPSAHSPGFGGKPPFPGEIPCSCEVPFRTGHYKCGDVHSFHIRVAGRTLYHLGSANLMEDEIVHREVDVLMLCIAGRFAVPGIVENALGRLGPDVVVPMHYDNFFRPVSRPLQLLPRTRFGEFVDDVDSVDKSMTVRTLSLDGTVGLV